MDVVDIIDTSLRALSSAARSKKVAAVRSAAERALTAIHTTQTLGSEAILRPYLAAASAKQPKLTMLAITGLSTLASHDAIVPEGMGTVLSTLSTLSAAASLPSDEQLLIKIVQTLTALITASSHLVADALALALSLALNLAAMRASATVCGLATAALRQLVRSVFERVAAEDAAPGPLTTTAPDSPAVVVGAAAMRPAARDALHVFHTLCALTNGESPAWLASVAASNAPLPSLSVGLGLELLEVVLASIAIDSMYLAHPELTQMLQEAVCPLLIKNFSQLDSFAIGVRLFRVVALLVADFGQVLVMEVEILANMLFKLFDGDAPQLALLIGAMEVIHKWMATPGLARRFAAYYDAQDGSTNVFADGLRLVAATLGAMAESKALRASPSPVATPPQMPFLDLLADAAPPRKISNYAIVVGTRVLAAVADATAAVAADDRALASLMFGSHRAAHAAVLAVFALPIDDAIATALVSTVVAELTTAVALGLPDAASALVHDLVATQHPLALGSLVDLAAASPSTVVYAWPHVVSVVLHLGLDSESVRALVAASATFDADTLVAAVGAAGASDPLLAAAPLVYALAAANVARLGVVWAPVSAFGVATASAPDAATRAAGLKAFAAYLGDALVAAPVEDHAAILGAFRRLCSSKYEDTHLGALAALLAALQGMGEAFNESHSGWPVVIDLLADGVYHAERAAPGPFATAVLAHSYRCVAFVLTDFLESVPRALLPQLIDTVAAYASQLVDLNVSLTAVGALWRVADFLKSSDAASDALWVALFSALAHLATVVRSETRNCAIRTLFKTLTTHGGAVSHTAWATLLPDVVFHVLAFVRAASAALSGPLPLDPDVAAQYIDASAADDVVVVHHSRDSPAKQYVESNALVLDGLVSLYRSLAAVLVAASTGGTALEHWAALLDALVGAAAEAAAPDAPKGLAMVGARGFGYIVAALERVDDAGTARALYEAWWGGVGRALSILVARGSDESTLKKNVVSALLDAVEAGVRAPGLGSPRHAVPVLATLFRGSLGVDTYLEAQGKVSDVEGAVLALAAASADRIGASEYVGLLLGALEDASLTAYGLLAALDEVERVLVASRDGGDGVRGRAADVLVMLAARGSAAGVDVRAAHAWCALVRSESPIQPEWIEVGLVGCGRAETSAQIDIVAAALDVLAHAPVAVWGPGTRVWDAVCSVVECASDPGVRTGVASLLRSLASGP